VHRFVVGTGRCGSTLLSKMLRENDRVASLFEHFSGLDGARRLARTPIDGPAFTDMICEVHAFTTMVLARGYHVPEVAYPFDRPGMRFARETGVPFVLSTMIPSLGVDDPDAFYDELRAFTRALPTGTALEQHSALFAWVTERLGKDVWVERSGGTIDALGALAGFPDARFLHIHRAGEEAALSMRAHHVFRLGIMMGYGLAPDGNDTDEERDPLSRMLESRPDAEPFGRFWTDEVLHGFRALAGLDAAQYHEIRFEDLIARPRDVLAEVADFFDLPQPHGAWRDRAAALVHGTPPTRFDQLEAAERRRLADACRPGNLLLDRVR